jgi:hypothetical protein
MSDSIQDQPPVFKNWSSWYWLVLGITALQFIIYYFITAAF